MVQLIPLAIAAGTSLYQHYKANQQRDKANSLKPSNYVPPALQDAEATAQMSANAESPGYSRGLDKIKQSTENTINAATRIGGNPAQVAQQVADADLREKELSKDLAVSDASYRAGQRNNLQNIQLAKSGYQKASYDAFTAAQSALRGAADQNDYSALMNLGEGAVNALPDKAFLNNNAGMNLSGVNPNEFYGSIYQRLKRDLYPSQTSIKNPFYTSN